MEEKLEHIINKSCEMFAEYGIRSVSMDDICREMGISKKTLYQYVPNKPELIEKALVYSTQKQMKEMAKRINKNMNAIDILLEASVFISEMFQDFKANMSFDLNKFYPDIYKAYSQKKNEMVKKEVIKNLKMGIKQGLYRDDLDIELVSGLYVHKIKDLHNPEFFNEKEFQFQKVFEVMFENHIRGIANETGIRYYEEKREKIKF